MFFFFAKNIAKPIEHRIVYDYRKDVCKEYAYRYMFSPVSRENKSFSPYVRKIPKVTTNRYGRYQLPHDTNANWGMFGKNLVITVDDSYDFEQTRRMFELLKSYGITATFFPNTIYINPNNPEHVKLWKEIYNSGYEIGYHTTDHSRKKSIDELNTDFASFTQHFRGILGDSNFSIKSVRAPYGYWDKVWFDWVAQNNLFNVRWTMTDTEDGNYLRELYEKGKGTVLLLHNKESDVEWLRTHIGELIEISKENAGKLGGIYDSIIR